MSRRVRRVALLLTGGLLAMPLVSAAPVRSVTAVAVASAPQPALPGRAKHWQVTLITGDRVMVTQSAAGAFSAAVDGGTSGQFHITRRGDELYVIPASVLRLVPKVLDPALFDVRGLIQHGYDDARVGAVPVLVRQAGQDDAGRLEASTRGALDARRVLRRVGLVTAKVRKDRAGRLGKQLASRAASGRAAVARGSGFAGVQRMWLDRPVQALWDHSLEQVGAPAAWAAGFDGTGVEVAVLDTGIDATHPDLVGQLIGSKDFTDSGSVKDGHGHGTHVAALVAGTGAGNVGLRKGVAPGAKLLVGKVLDDDGMGSESGILAGMEWAVAQDADIVSMSLGGGPSDGTDPLSLAVNTLTAQGSLFVIAAGNSGERGTISSPAAADAALTVAAVEANDRVAWFSSRGPRSGDMGLKPDVAAPGVDIIAARAAGTSMGEPVDARYTSASGTSMATPMVAGAAAVLLQRHPDWTPVQIKAALAGTADAEATEGPYGQGGGRLDIAEALDATVLPVDEDADLGLLTYPQTDVATTTAAWRNDGPAPVTLDLTLDIKDADPDDPGPGPSPPAPAPPGDDASPAELPAYAWLSASSVTVAPGGTADVTITVDPRITTPGDYAGYLVAAVRGTDTRLQTPVGFHDEVESFTLTVRGTNRAGGPLAGAYVSVTDVEQMWRLPFTIDVLGPDGTASLRLPKGHYQASTVGLDSRGAEGAEEYDALSILVNPQFAVTGDTEVALDARLAHRLDSTLTGIPTSHDSMLVEFDREDSEGSRLSSAIIIVGTDVPIYVLALPPVTLGAVRTTVTHRLIRPKVQLRLADGRQFRGVPAFGAALPPAGPLLAVDVGSGTQAEFDAQDVRGRLAVVRRGQPVPDLAARAQAAGAALLTIVNDAPGPFEASNGPVAGQPTVLVDGAEGPALLAAAAAAEPVTVVVEAQSRVTYDLAEPSPGNFRQPYAKVYSAAEVARLARIDARYSRKPTGQIYEGRGFWTESGMLTLLAPVSRNRRTEYVTPDMTALQTVIWLYPMSGIGAADDVWFEDAERRHRPGSRSAIAWLGDPLRATLLDPVFRADNSLRIAMGDLTDGAGHRGFVIAGSDEPDFRSALRLYRNGKLVGASAQPVAEFRMSRSSARYRLVADVATRRHTPLRTRGVDYWEFTSQRAPGGEVKLLALPVLDYDLTIDDASLLTSRRLKLNVQAQPYGPRVKADRVRFWYSTDAGKSWRPAEAVRRVVGNQFAVRLPTLRSGAVLSFRTEVITTAGVRHVETLYRATKVR